MMPHLWQKSSNSLDVNTLAPSVVTVIGIPNVVIQLLNLESVWAVVSFGSFHSSSQLLYLSTMTR